MKAFRISLYSALLTIAFSAVATAQNVQTDFDRSFNLAGLKTFAFSEQNRKPGDPLAASPINDRRIHDVLEAQLKLHGFAGANGKADFNITYFATTRAGLDIQDNRMGVFYRSGGLNVSQVTEGTLVVIFTDAVTQQEVWRGFLTGVVTPKDLDKDLNKGIAKLVEKFVKNQAGKK